MISKLATLSQIGVTAGNITGSAMDGATAAGYAAFVESITGVYPAIKATSPGKAEVWLSAEQTAKMRAWIDRQILDSIIPGKRPAGALDLRFGDVMAPLSIKYLIILGSAFFVLGWAGASVAHRR